MKQAVLLLKRRESNRPGQFRPKSDQEGLLSRGMGYLSGQPTKLSGDFGRKKCRDPYSVKEQECYALLLLFTSSVTLRLVTAYVAIPLISKHQDREHEGGRRQFAQVRILLQRRV